MKNTKYIKVSVSDRLPYKEGDYFISSSSRTYEDERKSFFNGTRFIDKYGSNMHVDYWLQEVPDYEDEMKEMLEAIYNETNLYYEISGDTRQEIKALLNKIKQQ